MDIWEGVFSLVASIIITIMGAVLLRVGKLEASWHAKMTRAVEAENSHDHPTTLGRFAKLRNKYAFFLLPFVTILREGFEGVLFIAGVVASSPISSIPLSVLAGMIIGVALSYMLYRQVTRKASLEHDTDISIRGRNMASMQQFLLIPTCLLYLIAAGLFSRGVWHLEAHQWNNIVGGDAAELGSGPGSYDIRNSVWHVNVSRFVQYTCMGLPY